MAAKILSRRPVLIGLIGFAIVCLIGIGGRQWIHRRQAGADPQAMLRQADEARDRVPPDEGRESEYLRKFVAARPEATDQRERLARLLAKTARTTKQLEDAFLAIEETLRRDPSRDDLRRHAAELAFDPKLQLYAEAEGHLRILRERQPGDGELAGLLARSLMFQDKHRESSEEYEKSYSLKSDQLDAYQNRARLLREKLSSPDEADRVMRLMVEKNPGDHRARLSEAGYWLRAGQRDSARSAIRRARELAPNDLEALRFDAELTFQTFKTTLATGRPDDINAARKNLSETIAGLGAGIQNDPRAADLWLLKARMVTAAGGAAADAERVIDSGLVVSPKNVELLLAKAEYQLRGRDVDGAEKTREKLGQLGVPEERLEFSRASILMAREDWSEAARAFERVRANAVGDRETFRLASLRLGECLEEIDENDLSLEAFSRAVPEDVADDTWMPAVLGLARANAATGRIDEALRACQKIIDHHSPDTRVANAMVQSIRLRLSRATRSADPARADWRPVENALKQATRAYPDNIDIRLLQAEVALARNQAGEAGKIIDELSGRHPKEPGVWIARASLLGRGRTPRAAAELLARGRVELGDSIGLRLAQARHEARSKVPDAGGGLYALATRTDSFPKNQKWKLTRGLAQMAAEEGLVAESARLWDLVLEIQPNDFSARLAKFDRFLGAGDEATLQDELRQIGRLDGETGTHFLAARAAWLIWRAGQKNRSSNESARDLAEATGLVEQLEKKRPNWARVSLARAMLADLQHDPARALASYRLAVDRGIREPKTLRRLIELQVSAGQFAEAGETLGMIPNLAAAESDFQRLAAEVLLECSNPRRALELAAEAIPATSRQPSDWIWLGRIRWRAGDLETAARAFDQALALDPGRPESRLAIIEFLVSVHRGKPGDSREARARIEEAKKSLADKDLPRFLAAAHALVGDKRKAIESYEQARARQPDDVPLRIDELKFLTGAGEWALARTACERLTPIAGLAPDQLDFVRGMYVLSFAADPRSSLANVALETLGVRPGDDWRKPVVNETPARRKSRALALALQRDRAGKITAVSILGDNEIKLAPSEKFLLARTHDQLGDQKNVRVIMSELLAGTGIDPPRIPCLVFYASWLIGRREFKEATPFVSELEKSDPDSPRTLELKVRLLAGKRDFAGARDLLAREARKPDAPLADLAWLAERTGMLPEAGEYWRKLVDTKRESNPEVELSLAEFYGRTNQLSKALEICDRAWAASPPFQVARVGIEALAGSKTTDAGSLSEKIARKFEEASRAKSVDRSTLMTQLAGLRSLAGDHDGAIAILRGQVTDDPAVKSQEEKEARARALRNLAFLLGLHGHKHGEALALLGNARALCGDRPDLREAESCVLIDRAGQKDLDDARILIERIQESAPSGTAFFHRALLEKKLNRREEMIFAFREACRLGLGSRDLHPLERRAFEEMEREQKGTPVGVPPA